MKTTMTSDELESLDEKYQDEYLKFDRIENKRHQRPDLHAMLLMAEIFPGTGDIVGAAEHDEIWFNTGDFESDADYNTLIPITEEQFLELTRCGISWDSDTQSFKTFV